MDKTSKQLLKEGVLNGLFYGGCLAIISGIGYMRGMPNTPEVLQETVIGCVRALIN